MWKQTKRQFLKEEGWIQSFMLQYSVLFNFSQDMNKDLLKEISKKDAGTGS